MRLVYMGTPDFAVPPMEMLAQAGHEIIYAVTQPDAVRDRGKKVKFSPVKEKAIELGIPVLQPAKIRKNEEFAELLREAAPDAAIVAAYGKILPASILNIPKYGCLNIHGSLLPRFRGAAPIQAAIIESGYTIWGLSSSNLSFLLPLLCMAVVVWYGHRSWIRFHVKPDAQVPVADADDDDMLDTPIILE
jgi:methionyl-tRNA formyltransferase